MILQRSHVDAAPDESISWLTFKYLRATLAFVVVCGIVNGARAENWPRFRGNNGNGLSSDKGLPKIWTAHDYAWSVYLPGEGHSSPIVWENCLFVSAAADEGTVRHLICIDVQSGKQLWIRSADFHHNSKHNKNSWATATPTTDGQRVYVTFADDESHVVTAYDFGGKLLWRRNLGTFKTLHGHGSSPIVSGDLLIVPYDHNGPSSLMALNRVTGETVWREPREDRYMSYATPLVVSSTLGTRQLICSSGSLGIASYDLLSGRMNWKTGPMPGQIVGSPIFNGKILVQACGLHGSGLSLLAVDPFQLNEVALPRVTFERNRNLPYVPTPVAYGELLFLWSDNGVVSCVDAKSGDNIWTKRVGGNYSGSPICVDRTLYIIREDGTVMVLAAAAKFEKPLEMPLDDPSHSTPACANGRLYFRTLHRLVCLTAKL